MLSVQISEVLQKITEKKYIDTIRIFYFIEAIIH